RRRRRQRACDPQAAVLLLVPPELLERGARVRVLDQEAPRAVLVELQERDRLAGQDQRALAARAGRAGAEDLDRCAVAGGRRSGPARARAGTSRRVVGALGRYLITPQPIRLPALPDGWVTKSSTFSWTTSARPRTELGPSATVSPLIVSVWRPSPFS